MVQTSVVQLALTKAEVKESMLAEGLEKMSKGWKEQKESLLAEGSETV